MGFFLEEKAAQVNEPAQYQRRGGKKVKASGKIDQTATGCDNCALKATWSKIKSPEMPTRSDAQDPDLLVLGEAPGLDEDNAGKPFRGAISDILLDHIPRAGKMRVAFQNAVRCRPAGDRSPTAQEMHACSVHLQKDFQRYSFQAILGVGQAPLNALVDNLPGYINISRIHGTRIPVRIGDRAVWYYPVLHPAFVDRMKGKWGDGPAMPVFRADVRQFFRDVDTWGEPKIFNLDPKKVLLPKNRAEAEDLVRRMRGPVAIDLETHKLKPYMIGARIIIASISDGETTIAFPCEHPEAATDWGIPFLLDIVYSRAWVAHNIVFELVWLMWYARKAGRDWLRIAPHGLQDTMAQMRLYHQRESLLSLAVGSRIHLGVNVKSIMRVLPERLLEYPLIEQLQYCGLDTMATAPIYRMLHNKVDKAGYEQATSSAECAAIMEFLGLPIDFQTAKEFEAYWVEQHASAEQEARAIYEVRQFEMARGKKFNLGSNDDVAEALVQYGKIKLEKSASSGHYTVDEEALNKHAKNHPLTSLVFRAREGAKMNSTYVQPILEVPKLYTDELLHPTYKPFVTATLRYGSEDPNIQNYPKRKHKQLRRVIKAGKAYYLVAFDFGQLQVRIIAMLSDDKSLKKQLIEGADMHTRWLNECLDIYPDYLDRLASATGEKDEEKIRKQGRTIIKSDFVFSNFFGASAGSIAVRTGIPLPLVENLQEVFWHEFRGVKNWIKKQRQEYQDTGGIRLPSGRVRHGILTGNEPINTPVQGAEADIVQRAQDELIMHARRYDDIHFLPRINIHDDLTFLLKDNDELPEYIDTIGKIMVEPNFDWITVPLTVEAGIGKNWADQEHITLFTGDYYR